MMKLPASVRRAFRPPPKLSLVDWAERSVVIPSDKSSRPGAIRLSWTPYWREPLNCLSDDRTKMITLMAPAQVGKTTMLLLAALYYLDQRPSTTIWASPRQADANEINNRRLKPLIEASPRLRHLIPESKSGWLKDTISTGAATLHFAGAGSPASLAQRAARVLLIDEVGKMAHHLKDEADPISLLLERSKTFWDRKVVMVSTPTTSAGLIHREFLSGDQREYYVPCPKCSRYQVLEFEALKWPSAEELGIDSGEDEHAAAVSDRGLAHYVCKGCDAHLVEKNKGPMLERGVWVPEGATIDDAGKVTGDKQLPIRSYHLSTLCSRWVSWSDVAAEFIRSKHSQNRLRNFTNSWMGKPWEELVATTSVSQITEKATRGYDRGEVPEGVKILTAGIDVQEGYLVWVIRGWGFKEESWLIDYGRAEDWVELEAVLFGSKYGENDSCVSLACIDSGFDTAAVYSFCRSRKAICRPIKGMRTRAGAPISAPTSVELTVRGRRAAAGLKLWSVDTTFWKDHLADLQSREEGMGAWSIFTGVDKDYLRQITAEAKVLERTGEMIWKLKASGRDNHYLDCEVYALVAAHMRGVHLMREPSDKAPESTPKPEQTDQPDIEHPHLRRKPYGRRDGNGRKRAW